MNNFPEGYLKRAPVRPADKKQNLNTIQTMDKEQLKHAAADAFAGNDKVDTLWQAADGQCFFSEGDAVSHSKSLGKHSATDVIKQNRADLKDEIAKFMSKNENAEQDQKKETGKKK